MTTEREPLPSTNFCQTACLMGGCDDQAFSGGLCSLHGLQKYYREVACEHQAATEAVACSTEP